MINWLYARYSTKAKDNVREEEEEGPNKRKEQLAKSADSSCGKFDDGTIFFFFLSELNIQRDILHPG